MTKIAGFGRKDIQVADPMMLRIIGGATLLKGDERSDADTADDPSHPLWDGERLLVPLSAEEIANTNAYGVRVPIEIVKMDDTIVVVSGRRRVRRARVVNAHRLKTGEPPIGVDCVLKRPSSDTNLLEWLILENEVRSADDVPAKIAKLKRLIERGVTLERAAVTFGVSVVTARGWLAFEDNATTELRETVASGEVSISAAAEIARVKEPEKQKAALATLRAAPSKSRVAARRAVASTNGTRDVGLTSRREIKALCDAVVAKEHRAGTSTGTLGWWEGVEDALKFVLGEESEERLAGLMKQVRDGD